VRGIEQMVVGQIADCAPMIVDGQHDLAEGSLMQPLLDQAQRVAALNCVRRCRRGDRTGKLAKCNSCAQATRVPVDNERRDDGPEILSFPASALRADPPKTKRIFGLGSIRLLSCLDIEESFTLTWN
jgi:hypothetical protein